MSIQNAKRMLKGLHELSELRDELYLCDTWEQAQAALVKAGLPFTWGEFEEASNLLHVGCQTHEEANELMNRVEWFRLLAGCPDPL